MRSGIYALASRDGAALDTKDLLKLGLDLPSQAETRVAVKLFDNILASRFASTAQTGTLELFFLGHLDEPAELAAAVNAPAGTNAAGLALAALRKWGPADVMTHLPGEWSLLLWDSADGSLLAGVSQYLRDKMFYSCTQRHVAIAPQPQILGGLSWVDAAYDDLGFPLSASRLFLRDPFMGDRSMLRGVKSIEPGSFHLFSPDGSVKSFAPPPAPPPLAWSGDFDTAVAALEAGLRQIVRESLARHGTIALMLSGGLDSSLLAWITSEERRPGQDIICLTSAAPLNSGISDEREQATLVAKTFGLPLEFIVPAEHIDPYRLSPPVQAQAEGIASSGKEYLFDAIYTAARAAGADAIMSGVLGEMTITRKETLLTPKTWLKAQLSTLRSAWSPLPDGERWPDHGFFVRFSRNILNALPSHIRDHRRTWQTAKPQRASEKLGYCNGFETVNRFTTATAYGLRRLSPFRDPRLNALAAGMPTGFTCHGGAKRAIARAMMKGHVPDIIRLRKDKGPFSPPHEIRLQRHAGAALARLEDYRRSDAAIWLDLDWLKGGLEKLGSGASCPIAEYTKIQGTALAADILQQWTGTS